MSSACTEAMIHTNADLAREVKGPTPLLRTLVTRYAKAAVARRAATSIGPTTGSGPASFPGTSIPPAANAAPHQDGCIVVTMNMPIVAAAGTRSSQGSVRARPCRTTPMSPTTQVAPARTAEELRVEHSVKGTDSHQGEMRAPAEERTAKPTVSAAMNLPHRGHSARANTAWALEKIR